MLEQRAEFEAAELLRQTLPAPVSEAESLPVGQVLSYRMAAEAVRDCVSRPAGRAASMI